jgi:hypothetical protein
MAGVWVLPAPRFVLCPAFVWLRSFLVFFYRRPTAELKENRHFFSSRFRAFLCMGISNTTAHISLQKNLKKSN